MRNLLAVALLAWAGAGGCSMCSHPYDDCYPVVHEDSPEANQYGDYAANHQPASRNAAPSAMARASGRSSSSSTY